MNVKRCWPFLLISHLWLSGCTRQVTELPEPNYGNTLVLAVFYPRLGLDSEDEVKQQTTELQKRLGSARYVAVGFASFLNINYPAGDIDKPIQPAALAKTLELADLLIERTNVNGLSGHISIISGFFHANNALRASAIEQDVRNAQWFSDGWIADPDKVREGTVPPSAWITPSRYAKPLRARMEEGARIVGAHLAKRLSQRDGASLTFSGDGEVEFNYERNIAAGESKVEKSERVFADYSPFMVEEFRDWIRASRYADDKSPATDDDHDGHTLNSDYHLAFTTWRLRYFDESAPIPYGTYVALAEKLPSRGTFYVHGGFDAPRKRLPDDPYWQQWIAFRKQVIAQYVRDFATWMTTSPDAAGHVIPPWRFYSHQIPADFLFGETDGLRLATSGSFAETAVLAPIASNGITLFNAFNGREHKKTAGPDLFRILSSAGTAWGVFEYNPSIPTGDTPAASTDVNFYLGQLREMAAFHPRVIVPFAWSDLPEHAKYRIQDNAFEEALREFLKEIGEAPWGQPR